ncbi:LPP20 family lipoprotein [Colwellia sp. Arc7-D]|uniref:LPP20 family lipoprotein n=1 Tax=Colwellia sp. Arc7-D TaxID=2161872 RepID=UPI000D38F6CB|nr:LPP20 family lipoprotein [Colwellia sp. Arc7-D]AWB56231.1 hypothetical protein DBO93_00705 [Colwellia sp. Arc7-D]
MKNTTNLLLTILLTFIISGCGTTKNAGEAYAKSEGEQYKNEVKKVQKTIDTIPDWFLEVMPYDNNGFYAVAKGQSSDLTFAIREARLRAQTDLAGQVSQLITAQEKLFGKSVQGLAGNTMQTVIESFIKEANVAGTRYDRKELVQVGNEYLYFVRAYLPVTAMAEAQQRANFAKDLQLESEQAQHELMLRVAKAEKEQLNREKVVAEKKVQ